MKNKIIERVIGSLMAQREDLTNELQKLNPHDPTYSIKKSDLSAEIYNIDTQISMRIADCEIDKN